MIHVSPVLYIQLLVHTFYLTLYIINTYTMKTPSVINDFVVRVLLSLDNYLDCIDLLKESGYKDLGWLNSGIIIPEYYHCDLVYSNRSGTTCLYADHRWKVYYSVDMGD